MKLTKRQEDKVQKAITAFKAAIHDAVGSEIEEAYDTQGQRLIYLNLWAGDNNSVYTENPDHDPFPED